MWYSKFAIPDSDIACVKNLGGVQFTLMNMHEGEAAHDKPSAAPETQTDNGFFAELIKFALIAVLIVLPIRLFIAQPFIVSGSSMVPTFENGEYLIVDELTYRLSEPERGDVVIFRFPQDPSKFFIKRIIGLPGETITIQGGTVTIVNSEHPNGLMLEESYTAGSTAGSISATLDEDTYFVLGDNRPSSSDSRIWGPLDRDKIIGRAFFRLLPVTKISVFPGIDDK